jgi:hypothetical protein
MKKVIKKAVAKAPVKKTVAKKPMMKTGGAKKSLPKAKFGRRKGNPTSSDPFGPKAGPLTEDQANYVNYRLDRSRFPKENYVSRDASVRLNPYTSEPEEPMYRGYYEKGLERSQRYGDTFNTSSKPNLAPGDQMTTTFKSQKKGGTTKSTYKKGGTMNKPGCAKCGKMMSKGGVKKYAAGGSTLSGSAIKKAPVQLYGMPQENLGTSGQHGFKKGGAMSKINRAVTPGCRGGMVKDANGNCVDERKAKVGGSLKPVTGDKVGLSKLPTAVRNKMGYQKSGGTMKKAAGGPIIDKLKAKLAERKVTKAIKKSVKSSGKIIK